MQHMVLGVSRVRQKGMIFGKVRVIVRNLNAWVGGVVIDGLIGKFGVPEIKESGKMLVKTCELDLIGSLAINLRPPRCG